MAKSRIFLAPNETEDFHVFVELKVGGDVTIYRDKAESGRVRGQEKIKINQS